ncbi:unnamed protein product [Discosporangium mesarthrocarpum]
MGLGVSSTRGMTAHPGQEICLACSKPASGQGKELRGRDRFCSKVCQEKFGVQTGKALRAAVYERDRGVCEGCKRDTTRMVEELQATPSHLDRLHLLKTLDARFELRHELLNRLIHNPCAGNAWNADHVVAVFEGGGECGVDNLRTLCVLCHADVTKRQSRERADAALHRLSEGRGEGNSSGTNKSTEGTHIDRSFCQYGEIWSDGALGGVLDEGCERRCNTGTDQQQPAATGKRSRESSPLTVGSMTSMTSTYNPPTPSPARCQHTRTTAPWPPVDYESDEDKEDGDEYANCVGGSFHQIVPDVDVCSLLSRTTFHKTTESGKCFRRSICSPSDPSSSDCVLIGGGISFSRVKRSTNISFNAGIPDMNTQE